MKKIAILSLCILASLMYTKLKACSVFYFIDKQTGKIYVVNNEDYWYDVKPYIQIEPKSKNKLARAWYGWDNFAQGGINEAGLFFDAAVTPQQKKIPNYGNPKGNLGDEILSGCSTVDEALAYLENRKIALTQSHLMFGDKHGRAVIVEWVNGQKQLHWISDNKLIMTNFLLADTASGNYPCYRYNAVQQQLKNLEDKGGGLNLLTVGNAIGKAVQLPQADANGRIGGTVYTSFINITDMEFVLTYKLNNKNITKLDLKNEFAKSKKQKIKLYN